jgi:nucleotide-binding universal stress UspA family protein
VPGSSGPQGLVPTYVEKRVARPVTGWPWGPGLAEDGGSDPFRVLVPYNGTPVSRSTLDVVAGLVRSTSAVAWILYVRPWDLTRAGRFCLETSDEAQQCARAAVTELRGRGVPASGVVRDARRDRVAHVIAAEAERLDVGCIVLGTHAHGAWLSALLGSVTRKVVRRAARPVILVKAPHRRRRERRGH